MNIEQNEVLRWTTKIIVWNPMVWSHRCKLPIAPIPVLHLIIVHSLTLVLPPFPFLLLSLLSLSILTACTHAAYQLRRKMHQKLSARAFSICISEEVLWTQKALRQIWKYWHSSAPSEVVLKLTGTFHCHNNRQRWRVYVALWPKRANFDVKINSKKTVWTVQNNTQSTLPDQFRN